MDDPNQLRPALRLEGGSSAPGYAPVELASRRRVSTSLIPAAQPSSGAPASDSALDLAFFGLRQSPFDASPDPDCLFLSSRHRQAFERLQYCVAQGQGLIVLTGAPGTGKSAVLRALMAASPSAGFGMLAAPWVSSSTEFMMLVLLAFQVTTVPATKAERALRLRTRLVELRQSGITPVLVVDEAHGLDMESFEEIRLLTNFEGADGRLLTVVLAGQPELAEILNRPQLRGLKQRIEVRIDLQPLAADEVDAYMKYRWTRAGGNPEIPFTREGTALIAKASEGIPGVINSICDNALLAAQAGKELPVATEHVKAVLRQLNLQPPEPTAAEAAMVRVGRMSRQDSSPQSALVVPKSALKALGTRPPLVMRLASWIGLGSIQWRRSEEN